MLHRVPIGIVPIGTDVLPALREIAFKSKGLLAIRLEKGVMYHHSFGGIASSKSGFTETSSAFNGYIKFIANFDLNTTS
jgi:hypothetical protein